MTVANAIVGKDSEIIGWATKWNPAATVPAECIVQYADGSADSAIFAELTFVNGHDKAREYLNSLEP